jgi:transposase
VWSVVRVPTVAEEDRRHLNRELVAVKRERTRMTNRIKGLLANQGGSLPWQGDVPAQLDGVRLWDGAALPSNVLRRLKREWDTVIFLSDQLARIESERREALRHSDDASIAKVRQLMMLTGIGANSSWLFVMEFFGWRTFHNRKEVGALAGLTPTARASGDVHHELGISKTGNRQLRAIAMEMAWGWLRFQPTSALTAWYQERLGRGSGRLRRIGIVALARRLLIALWHYLETGVLPEGAELKPTCPF